MTRLCPGLAFDGVDERVGISAGADLVEMRTNTGPLATMTARGLLADEGLHALPAVGRTLSRPACLRKMAWLMPRMARAVPYPGHMVVDARKPAPVPAAVAG